MSGESDRLLYTGLSKIIRNQVVATVISSTDADDIFSYDDTESPEISDTNITVNSEMMAENHSTLVSTRSTSSHTLNKSDSTKSLRLYKYFPKSRQKLHMSKRKPPSSEILECITTSFNERIPTPKHVPSQTRNSLSHNRDQEMILTATNNGHPALTLTVSGDDQSSRPLLDRRGSRCREGTTLDTPKTKSLNHMIKHLRSRSNSKRLNKIQLTERKQETKAAKTLSAILLVFICTWSPYMLCTMIKAFDQDVIPDLIYHISECKLVACFQLILILRLCGQCLSAQHTGWLS